jgi:hypothetical protein
MTKEIIFLIIFVNMLVPLLIHFDVYSLCDAANGAIISYGFGLIVASITFIIIDKL